jgi:Fis family transcriptional regulator
MMTSSERRERRKQPIRRSVQSALELYLDDLSGHQVNDLYHMVLGEVEPALLNVVMHHVDGNQSQAADMLGITRATLRKKLKQYGLEQ